MKPEVFIIESLRPEDEDRKWFEGRILQTILKMGGRKPRYRYVRSRADLLDAIRRFAASNYRYLHLSSHGNAHGLGFRFGYVPFEMLTRLLRNCLRNKRLFVSACKAVNKHLAWELIPKTGCMSIIGPYETVDFDDIAIVWAAYYYLALRDNQSSMKRALIVERLRKLTRLFGVRLKYYSKSRSKGVRLASLP